MTLKTILAVCGSNFGDTDLKIASELAEDIGAHLSLAVIQAAVPLPIADSAVVFSDVWLQERQAEAQRLDDRAKAMTEFLAARALSADVAVEYTEFSWLDEAIGRRARYADLTLVGPECLRSELKEKVIEGALFASGKPLLVVPNRVLATLRPKRMMVGWDATIEATRAVREALPLLTSADAVHVVLVDPVESPDGHGAEPGADVAAYLARHGVNVSVDRLPSEGHAVATVLRRHAVDCAADMIVMGAYGHSRLRERLFGGVTKSMLDEPPLPVLMAR